MSAKDSSDEHNSSSNYN